MPTTKSKNAGAVSTRTPEAQSALKELFADSLKDILWAEKQLVKSLKKMSKAANIPFFLRQKGSPESKPGDAPFMETGKHGHIRGITQ